MKTKVLSIVAALCLKAVSLQGCSLSPGSSITSSAHEINESAGSAFAAFEDAEGMSSDIGDIANSDNIVVTKDEGKSITYTIASSLDKGGSTITFHFDDLGGDRSSVRAEVDAPPVARGKLYLSEHKIRDVLDKSLKQFASALNDQRSSASALRDINSTLLQVDIVTNSTNESDDMQIVFALMGDGDIGETSVASLDRSESDVSDSAITGAPSMEFEDSSEDQSDWSDNEYSAGSTTSDDY